MPTVGYQSLAQANATVINYITGYYNKVRSHQYNGGLDIMSLSEDTGIHIIRGQCYVKGTARAL